jgi:hypothetical protein
MHRCRTILNLNMLIFLGIKLAYRGIAVLNKVRSVLLLIQIRASARIINEWREA